MPTTGAQRLVESLIATGVKHLFSLSGNQILSIYDATIGRDIDIIHTRHEAAAVHMADGWGRLTEEPGVALVAAGPGHCNAISGLYVALMAESPMVLLSGHCPAAQIGQGAFQEMDQVAIARPVCKAAWLVKDADRLDADVARAFSIAKSGRPGPVYLSLPADLLEASSFGATTNHYEGDALPLLNDAQVEEVLDLLGTAQRPLILGGPAMARPARWKDVAQLAEIAGIAALGAQSPRGVDDPWLHAAANSLARADLVLLVGKKLDFSLKFGRPPFFADECRFVQIDADKEQLSQDGRVSLTAQADPVRAVRQLREAASKRHWPSNSWKAEMAEARRTVPDEWDQLARQQPIHPLGVCAAVRSFLAKDAVIVSDGGEFGQWVQAGLEAPCRLINGPSGSIGSSLPMGLAAKLAYPQHQVVVFQGDGTFGYHAMEFDTAIRYDLPVIVIVGSDARWNAEHQMQIKHFGEHRTVGCDLLPSRYDKVVEALGGYGEYVQELKELSPALERAAASRLPACINVAIDGAAAPTFRPAQEGH